MTTLLSSLLVLHAFLHLIGFSQEWNLGPMNKFKHSYSWLNTPSVKKIMGVGWFTACVSLLATAYLYFTDQNDLFRIVGVISLSLSQPLIVVYWSEARYGTVVNWILLLMIVFSNSM